MEPIYILSTGHYCIEYPENKKRWHQKYFVTWTFKDHLKFSNPHHGLEILHQINLDNRLRGSLNSLLLIPEFHPGTTNIHYHGIIDFKDLTVWKKRGYLRLFEKYGSFHMNSYYPVEEPIKVGYACKHYLLPNVVAEGLGDEISKKYIHKQDNRSLEDWVSEQDASYLATKVPT